MIPLSTCRFVTSSATLKASVMACCERTLSVYVSKEERRAKRAIATSAMMGNAITNNICKICVSLAFFWKYTQRQILVKSLSIVSVTLPCKKVRNRGQYNVYAEHCQTTCNFALQLTSSWAIFCEHMLKKSMLAGKKLFIKHVFVLFCSNAKSLRMPCINLFIYSYTWWLYNYLSTK